MLKSSSNVRTIKTGRKHKIPHILDAAFQYTSAAATDITKTWRKFGWKPPAKKARR